MDRKSLLDPKKLDVERTKYFSPLILERSYTNIILPITIVNLKRIIGRLNVSLNAPPKFPEIAHGSNPHPVDEPLVRDIQPALTWT